MNAKAKRLTPTQIRARIVSALLALGYKTAELARENGSQKAWLRRPGKPFAKTATGIAKRVAKEIAARGVVVWSGSSKETPDRWGEFRVRGPGYDVVLNQQAETGNLGGAFVETWKMETGGRP